MEKFAYSLFVLLTLCYEGGQIMDGKMREAFLVMLAVRSVRNIYPERRGQPLARPRSRWENIRWLLKRRGSV